MDTKKKKGKKAVIVIFAVVVLIGITSLFMYFRKGGNIFRQFGIAGDVHHYNDTDTYGDFRESGAYSCFQIFPETLDEDMDVGAYFWEYQDFIFDPVVQVYLECTYEEDQYVKELERLQAVSAEYEGKVQKIRYDTKHFSRPAYVTIYANNHCYEYALVLGDRRIAYVFTMFVHEEDIKFPTEYLPKGYEREDKADDSYSMYIFYQKDGSGIGLY